MSENGDGIGRKRQPRECGSRSRRPLGLEQAYSTLMINQILGNPLEGETPTAQLKLIAVMTVISVLHSEDPTITLTRLVELTGLTRSVLAQDMNALVQRGLLIETMGNNSMGRGLARQFELSPAVVEALGMIMGEPIRDGR